MNARPRALLVDDDTAFCQILSRHLARRGWEVRFAHDAAAAAQALETFDADRILLDLRLGTDNGLNLIRSFLALRPNARIVLATGYASIATAVDAMRRGAWNYLPKPFDVDALIHAFEGEPQPGSPPAVAEAAPSLRRQGWEHVQRVLAECDGNISAAARVLGVDRRTLQRRLAKRPVRERP